VYTAVRKLVDTRFLSPSKSLLAPLLLPYCYFGELYYDHYHDIVRLLLRLQERKRLRERDREEEERERTKSRIYLINTSALP
jgi:hypothetical protein